MKIYLGLGSNLGDRMKHLEEALMRIKSQLKPSSFRISHLYETPALLLKDADPTWDIPFLNLAVEMESNICIKDLLIFTQKIELECGRENGPKWSPRVIDIDILLYGDVQIDDLNLKIPHPQMPHRAFVLDPLKDLNPQLRIPGIKDSVLSMARRHNQHAPVWMGILNITPDSFSDGGSYYSDISIKTEIDNLDKMNVGIIDIGAESTRPGANPVSVIEEWRRLEPALKYCREKFHLRHVRPSISVDTRNSLTAMKALEMGADVINDVSGFADTSMLDVLKKSDCQYVLMHNLTVPADPNRVISNEMDTTQEIKTWFDQKLAILREHNIGRNRIILDPGIGFGKNAAQSRNILKNITAFFDFDLPILMGHSRKSCLKSLVVNDGGTFPKDRDFVGAGISLGLIEQGVDILRVHEPRLHMEMFKGWNYQRSNS